MTSTKFKPKWTVHDYNTQETLHFDLSKPIHDRLRVLNLTLQRLNSYCSGLLLFNLITFLIMSRSMSRIWNDYHSSISSFRKRRAASLMLCKSIKCVAFLVIFNSAMKLERKTFFCVFKYLLLSPELLVAHY